ncbi:hypothetical protein PsYK624_068580 [Phanerochaete sordida]|uniref:FAS1 domain-containing protein n=1 Tax=Phanerochaete sordida TaxID=48140 RepID=A0A9P3LDM2_9APHY|nr:hypothetical protein PsYK624_068580 [Phanerochaete sordida]
MSPVVLAQAGTYFGHFIDQMNAEGYTNFTAWVHEVGADTPTSPFFQTINSVPSYTLFIPDNDAFANPSANFYPGVYQNNNPIFLAALLNYHLLPGTWLQSQLGSGYNHTILPTTMQADPPTLPAGVPQPLACGSTARGFEVYNQRTPTAVLRTFEFDDMLVNVVPAVLAPPPPYDAVAASMGLAQFEALRTAAGALSPALAGGGLTLFVPSDDAFAAANASGALAGADPKDVYNDHAMFGQSIWSTLFSAGTYATASGAAYELGTGAQGYTVTLHGVTANIVQADVLLTNGVVHVIDRVLVAAPAAGAAGNGADGPVVGPSPTSSTATTPTSGSSVGSTSESGSGAATSPTSASTGLAASSAPPAAHAITPGVIVAIVAIAAVLLAVPLTLLYVVLARRRRARRRGSHASVFDLPSPALRTEPFYAHASAGSVGTPRELRPPRAYGESTVSSVSLPPEAKVMPEKVDGPFNVHGLRAYTDADAAAPPSIVIPTEVVDQIVQQLARRIDRERERAPAPPPGLEAVPDDAPPLYESPPPRLNIIFDHERNEEV